jgi:hypothetical protein
MRVLWIVVLVVAAVAVVAGIASNAYEAGLMRGQAESAPGAPPQAGPPPGPYPYPHYYGPYWHRPFGFGFLGFLFPLLFIFLIFALLKGAFWGWRGPWHYGYGTWRSGGVPPAFEEWHRRAHESGPQGQKM